MPCKVGSFSIFVMIYSFSGMPINIYHDMLTWQRYWDRTDFMLINYIFSLKSAETGRVPQPTWIPRPGAAAEVPESPTDDNSQPVRDTRRDQRQPSHASSAAVSYSGRLQGFRFISSQFPGTKIREWQSSFKECKIIGPQCRIIVSLTLGKELTAFINEGHLISNSELVVPYITW